MRPIPRVSLPDRVAAHLREGIQEGRWSDRFPGVQLLAEELGVARHTVRRALLILENEGVLAGRGRGRSRSITAATEPAASLRPLRVAIMRHDVHLTDNPISSAVLIEIKHSLEALGHVVFFCKKSQIDLRHDVRRIAIEMAKTAADAWIVEAGSRSLLEWCASQQTPCLALYGRSGDLPLARTGPDAELAYRAATRHLLALGHRRIVLIAREARRKPIPGKPERAFLEELEAHGVATGDYNLPNWEETPAGFFRLLDGLFQHTPPTALIVDEPPRCIATITFLGRRSIKVPEQVSLVSSEYDPLLSWCHPCIAYFHWDYKLVIRRVLRWVDNVRKGKPDRKVVNFPLEFHPGGSIGPVWKG